MSGAVAALQSRLRLSAPTNQKIGSATGYGAALKTVAPGGAPQHLDLGWLRQFSFLFSCGILKYVW